jgi:hypothetical protein
LIWLCRRGAGHATTEWQRRQLYAVPFPPSNWDEFYFNFFNTSNHLNAAQPLALPCIDVKSQLQMAIGTSTYAHGLSKQANGGDSRGRVPQLFLGSRRKRQSRDFGNRLPAAGADAADGGVEEMGQCLNAVNGENGKGQLDGHAVGGVDHACDGADHVELKPRSGGSGIDGEDVGVVARKPLFCLLGPGGCLEDHVSGCRGFRLRIHCGPCRLRRGLQAQLRGCGLGGTSFPGWCRGFRSRWNECCVDGGVLVGEGRREGGRPVAHD